MQPESWGQLSISSRHALLWAGALARYRAEQEGQDPTSAQADPFDLLVGMLLEHPDDAEPKILLDHFRIAPGEVLPPTYERPSPEAVERHLREAPADGPPPTDPELSIILEEGTSLGLSSGSAEVAELRALFAAMLQSSNPLASALEGLLAQRGATLSEISQSIRGYLLEPESRGSGFARFLEERHPFSPQPIDIPNYKADHGRQTDLADDLVGVRAEVDAFAYLLASRGLQPPLAVGLFGEWGSGKSFFMDAVRRRIDQLTSDSRIRDRPQSEIPFWKRIVQIRFNAWHYIEGELWASLVDHIFNQLRLDGDNDKDDLVAKRRQHWLEKLDQTRVRLARLESQRSEAARDLQVKHQEADLLRRQRDSEFARLEHLQARAATDLVVKESLNEVTTALKPFMISVGLPTAEEIFDKIGEARQEAHRGRALLASLWQKPADRVLVLALLVLVPSIVWVLSLVEVSVVATAFSGLSATAAAAIAALGRATQGVRARLKTLETAESRVRREVDGLRAALNKKIEGAETSIREADKRLESVVEEQQGLSTELESIQGELEDITPARVLSDFVAERVGSADYRKHLGIPALIQEDFRNLAKLIADQNDKILEGKDSKLESSVECFNRVILYIDDLDRCPDEHVIEVLQAVHLLLAFELFVVVVAVDSRWLSHALTQHFGALAMNRSGLERATPDDYLEKIFQIPFWIQPLGDPAKRNIVRGLLRGHLKGQAGAGAQDETGDRPAVEKAQRGVLASLGPANAPPNLQAAALAITHAELTFLDELAPLMGTTPRSAKRFVNLYQLVRIIHRVDPAEVPPIPPPDHELLPFVLALGEGLPKLGPALLRAARAANGASDFETLLNEARSDADPAETRRLDEWLATREPWKKISGQRIADAFSKIDRFLFRVGSS